MVSNIKAGALEYEPGPSGDDSLNFPSALGTLVHRRFTYRLEGFKVVLALFATVFVRWNK